MQQADRVQILAYRLAAQHLTERAPDIVTAAGASGAQNTPPGSAPLALHARVDGLTAEAYGRALAEEKTLVEVWSLRASPYVIPTADLPVFTRGLLPTDDDGMGAFIQGMAPILAKETFTTFTATLARAASLYELFCLAPREGKEATFARLDQWLGRPPPRLDDDAARAELVRRYLRCYGPSTVDAYAAWTGTALRDAGRSWALVRDELVQVDADGRTAALLAADAAALDDPLEPRGVWFLPPHDPLLLLRDRDTLLPDRSLHKLVWKAVGNPGVVLANGDPLAIWRPRKQGSRLTVVIEPLTGVPVALRGEVAAEAATLARYRGATTVEVEFS